MHFEVTYRLGDCSATAIWMCFLFIIIGCGHTDSTHSETETMSDDASVEADAQIGHGSVIETDSAKPDSTYGCDATYLEKVSGTVLDYQRRPVSAAKAQVCVYTPTKDSICIGPVETDDNGRWTIALPNDFRCVVKGSSRVVDPGGNRVTDVCGFNASTTSDLDLGDMVLTEGTHEWTKDDLTLTHADGVTLVFDHQDALDNVNADIEVALDFNVSETCFGNRYRSNYRVAITPEGWADGITLSALPAGQLPDGAIVDIFLIGGLYSELPNGEILSQGDTWHFTTATVAHGRIRVAQKLPFLGWLHVRRQ